LSFAVFQLLPAQRSSQSTEDKTMFDEFLEIHSPEEELRKE
jgi:hypothetical protein